MDWKKYWDQIGSEQSDLVSQVQRSRENEADTTANYIKKVLEINPKDQVLDVCCGNGLLTKEIAKSCFNIVGIDQSEKLIGTAEENFKNQNCSFVVGSAMDIPQLIPLQFDKIYLEFSFQYFDQKEAGEKVIQAMLDVLKPQGKLFIGDIPEKGKENKLYDSMKKKMYHWAAKIRGKDSMGKFWSADEIYAICKKLNVEGEKMIQPPELPYSHYRFDFLINK